MNKKFAAEGGTYQIIHIEPHLAEGIEAFNQVYGRSWKKPEPFPEFIPGFIRWLAAEGKLRLGVARLGNDPIAAQLWLVHCGKAYIYKVAYDEEHTAFTPGTLVTSLLMQFVIDQDKVKEVDYLIGDDKYKKTWMSHRRERWGIVAYNQGKLFGILLLIKEVLGRCLKRCRAHHARYLAQSTHTKNQ